MEYWSTTVAVCQASQGMMDHFGKLLVRVRVPVAMIGCCEAVQDQEFARVGEGRRRQSPKQVSCRLAVNAAGRLNVLVYCTRIRPLFCAKQSKRRTKRVQNIVDSMCSYIRQSCISFSPTIHTSARSFHDHRIVPARCCYCCLRGRGGGMAARFFPLFEPLA